MTNKSEEDAQAKKDKKDLEAFREKEFQEKCEKEKAKELEALKENIQYFADILKESYESDRENVSVSYAEPVNPRSQAKVYLLLTFEPPETHLHDSSYRLFVIDTYNSILKILAKGNTESIRIASIKELEKFPEEVRAVHVQSLISMALTVEESKIRERLMSQYHMPVIHHGPLGPCY